MKIYLSIMIVLSLLSTPLFAEIDGSLFDSNGNFLECTLEDGRPLLANDYWVAVGDIILSKDLVATTMSPAADWVHYVGHDYDVNVYKQFCGRGGLQGVQIIHTSGKGSLGTVAPGTEQVIACQERDQCITDDDGDFML